jgi:hypothetical protein
MDWNNVIILQTALCAVSLAAGLFLFYRFYGMGINPITQLLLGITKRLNNLPPCTIKNLASIQGIFTESKNTRLQNLFMHFQSDTELLLRREAAPEASVYFYYKNVFAVPHPEYYRHIFQGFTLCMSVITVAAPPAWVLLQGHGANEQIIALGISLVGLIWLVLTHVLLLFLEKNAQRKAYSALETFTATLRRALPTSGEGTQSALLLEGVRRTRESFSDSAERIADKIGSFAADSVTPVAAKAFEQAIVQHINPVFASIGRTLADVSEAIIQKQEDGMRNLAAGFSQQLSANIEVKMKALGDNVETVNKRFSAAADNMEKFLTTVTRSLEEDKAALHTMTSLSAKTTEVNRQSSEQIAKFSASINDMKVASSVLGERIHEALDLMKLAAAQNQTNAVEHVKRMTETRTAFSEALEAMKAVVTDNAKQYTEYGARLEGTLTAASGSLKQSYEQAHALISTHLNKTGEMIKESHEQSQNFMTAHMEEASGIIKESHEQNRAVLAANLEEAGNIMKDTYEKSSNLITSKLEEAGTVIKEAVGSAVLQLERGAQRNSEAVQQVLESNTNTTARLGQTMDALANMGTEQYEKSMKAGAALIDNVVAEMNKALGGVGQEIADGIGKGIGESMEIVERLAAQTDKLKQEYDQHFKRVDEQNRESYDELDFHMQNVIARFAQEAEGIIGKLQESISGAMGLFEGNTAALLTNLEEQSRSIGLSAKELSFDVSTLSANLKESVSAFSGHLHDGVVRTFDDFDAGLSEVSKRLADTVESIRDAVEHLPQALSNKN